MDPLLLDIPDRLETPRLILRVPRAGDGQATNAAIVETFETLRPWLPWAQTVPTLEQSEANCRRAWAQFQLREDITLRLFLKECGTMIGSAGLHRIDWSVPKFEIGYWVGRNYEGKGYATEAARAIAALAIEKLGAHRLQIHTDARNEKSSRVAERCGFTLEALHRNYLRDPRGRLCDIRIYGLVVNERSTARNGGQSSIP